MRGPYLIKNVKLGYSLAGIFYLMAVGFFIAHWMGFGSFFAALAIFQTLGIASAHKHLSKDHRSKTDGV